MTRYFAKCVRCDETFDAVPNTTTCPKCSGILDIQYDYKLISEMVSLEKIKARDDRSMWRYREFLPVLDDCDLSKGLRIGGSPLYDAPELAKRIGLSRLHIKDDGLNPTSSLKDRASAMAVVKAKEAGASVIACSSTGNAASSLAGNAAACGLTSYIFVPERAPQGKVTQLLVFGANVISVKGSYEDTFKLSAEAIERWGWYNRNAAINPYLSEGKKTVSYEIAEQLNWQVPDYVAVSVGDGCTIAGVWKGFKDLFGAGFITKLPRLISVQAEGCCPVHRAIESGTSKLIPMEENTLADSIAVGVPRNFDKAIAAIKESSAVTVNVSDAEILEAMALLGKTCGVFGEPAGVAGTAGIIKAVAQKKIPADASVVSIVTGNGLKDIVSGAKAVNKPMSVDPNMDDLLIAFKNAGIKLAGI